MAVCEDVGPALPRGPYRLAPVGWIILTGFAALVLWAALSAVGPLPAADHVPDWHGNVKAGG